MEANNVLARPSSLINIAAVALIVASLSAVAAIFGLIPSARSEKQEIAAEQARLADAESARSGERAHAESRGRPVQSMAPGCANCGVVEAVRAVQVPGQGSGLGAVAGGLTGAVAGSQFGRGNGRTALGVLGAVGGAYAGNSIEKNMRSQTSYRVTVRMDDGTMRTVYQSQPPAFASGDKVRVVNGTLAARG